MKSNINDKNAAVVAMAILDMDIKWTETFGDLDMTDLNYSDLFMRAWLARNTDIRKTDLYDFMPGVSRRTAVKYVQKLVDHGWLIETPAEDKRVKYIKLAAEITARLERFLGYTYERFSQIKTE